MKLRYIVISMCVAWTVCSNVALAADFAEILQSLKKSGTTGVSWIPKSVIEADFTCDGRPDVLVRGREGDNAVVALLPGSDKHMFAKPQLVWPSVSDLKTFRIAKETQWCWLSDEEPHGDMLEGCKPRRGCWNFRVERDSVDSLHCYWNQKDREISCWSR